MYPTCQVEAVLTRDVILSLLIDDTIFFHCPFNFCQIFAVLIHGSLTQNSGAVIILVTKKVHLKHLLKMYLRKY